MISGTDIIIKSNQKNLIYKTICIISEIWKNLIIQDGFCKICDKNLKSDFEQLNEFIIYKDLEVLNSYLSKGIISINNNKILSLFKVDNELTIVVGDLNNEETAFILEKLSKAIRG
jgi:hypothetical protein